MHPHVHGPGEGTNIREIIDHLVGADHLQSPTAVAGLGLTTLLEIHGDDHRKADQRSGEDRREDAAYNHPDHYGGVGNPHEVIKCIHAHGLDFDLGNAVKYILRAGKKDPDKTIEDLRKAIWYIESEIFLLLQQ